MCTRTHHYGSLKSFVTQYLREKDKLTQDRQLLRKEMEGAVLQVRTQYEQQLELERSEYSLS